MKRITKVTIENFKRFQKIELELKSFDCLVGGNNSGKSTLLQALALFDFIVHNCLARKGDTNSPIEIKNRSIAPTDFVVLPVANAIDLWTDKLSQRKGGHILIRIAVEFDDANSAVAAVDLSFNRFAVSLETEKDQAWLKELAQFKISYLPVFSTFLTQEERKTPAVIEDALARGRVNSVVRNLLYNLSAQNEIKALEEILLRVFPDFKKMRVRFDDVSDRHIDVTFSSTERVRAVPLARLGKTGGGILFPLFYERTSHAQS